MIGVVNQRHRPKCCLQLENGIQAAAKTGTAQLNGNRSARAIERLDHRVSPRPRHRSTRLRSC